VWAPGPRSATDRHEQLVIDGRCMTALGLKWKGVAVPRDTCGAAPQASGLRALTWEQKQ